HRLTRRYPCSPTGMISWESKRSSQEPPLATPMGEFKIEQTALPWDSYSSVLGKAMGNNHLSEHRMRQFMLNTLELTEEESEHIAGWKCAECTETMRKVVTERTEPSPTTEADPDSSN